MKSIYIGVCKTRKDKKFEKSFKDFTDSICEYYSICINIVKNVYLPDAQNYLARECINADYDYLLLLDDDHWGHSLEMLNTLVKAKSWVATIKTYSRHYPYSCVALKRLENNFVMPIETGEGYVKCDLTGFPMTLIKTKLFDKLEYPYFRSFEAEGRSWNSDIDFFERLDKIGIKPIACFQHCLNHDKITQDNVFQYRDKERKENNNIAWFNLLKQGV